MFITSHHVIFNLSGGTSVRDLKDVNDVIDTREFSTMLMVCLYVLNVYEE